MIIEKSYRENMKNIVRSIKTVYKVCPLLVILGGLFSVLLIFTAPLYSLLDKYIFDFAQESYYEGINSKRILLIVLLYFLYNLLIFAFSKANQIIKEYSKTKVDSTIQHRIMKSLARMKYDSFEDNKYYDYIKTIQDEIKSGRLLGLYTDSIALLGTFITLVFLCYLLLDLGIVAVILAILCCIPGFLHQASFGKKNWEFNTSKVPQKRKLGYFFSLITNIKAFAENKVYNTMPYYKEKYSGLFNDYYTELKGFNQKNCWKGILMATIHSFGTVSVIAYAYYQAANGNITLGDAVLLVGVSQSVYNKVQSAVYYIGSLYEGKNYVNNLLDFIYENTEVKCEYDKDEKKSVNLDKCEIELSNVVYSYPGTKNNVLDGLNLRIRQGEKLAIVGENGSGKTTLAKTILGLCEPQSGKITINGIDIAELKDTEKYASACFQDYYTYSLSLRENIAFGDIGSIDNDNKINNAIDMSGLRRVVNEIDLDAFITKMFDSEGLEFSKGETQRLSISKAFMFDKGVLVLDEPSAALDIITENEIFETILRLMKSRTSIVITHRLSNVVNCDRIVYLESGKIVEEGTHKDLLALHGKYAELFELQAKNYAS